MRTGGEQTTGGPSSSCEMIILRNNSHGGIIRVCMGIFTTALGNKKNTSNYQKNTSPFFYSVSLVIWPLTLMKRANFSELFVSKFSTYIRKAQGWTLHFRTPDPRSKIFSESPTTLVVLGFYHKKNSFTPINMAELHALKVQYPPPLFQITKKKLIEISFIL